MLDIKAGADFKHVGDVVRNNSFYDVDFNFKKIDLESDEALDQSIENLLMTEFGERLFNFSFGTPLQAILFEQNHNTSEMRERVYKKIEAIIPIKISRDSAIVEFVDNNAHILSITFFYSSNDGAIRNHNFKRRFTI